MADDRPIYIDLQAIADEYYGDGYFAVVKRPRKRSRKGHNKPVAARKGRGAPRRRS